MWIEYHSDEIHQYSVRQRLNQRGKLRRTHYRLKQSQLLSRQHVHFHFVKNSSQFSICASEAALKNEL